MVYKKSPKNKSSTKRKSPSKRKLVKWGPYELQKDKTYRPKNKCFLIEQNYKGKCTRDPIGRFSDICYTNDYMKEIKCTPKHYQEMVYKFASFYLSNSQNRNEIFDQIINMSENKVIKFINNKMPSLEHLNKSHEVFLDLEYNNKNISNSVYDYKGIGYSNINTFMRGTFGNTWSPFLEHISYKTNNELPIKNVGDSSAPLIILLKYLFNLKDITKNKENTKKYNKIFIQKMKKSIEEMSKYFLEKTKNYNNIIKNIHLAIKKSVPLDKDIVVFRGFSVSHDIFENFITTEENNKNVLDINKFNKAIKFESKGKWINSSEENKQLWKEPLNNIIPKFFQRNYSDKCAHSLDELNRLYNSFFSLSISKLNKDSTFTEKGFTSTSYNPNVGVNFGGLSNSMNVSPGTEIKCLFRINLPKNNKFLFLTSKESNYDSYKQGENFDHDYEYEVVLPPAKYKVNEIFRAPSKVDFGRFYQNEYIIDIDFVEPL